MDRDLTFQQLRPMLFGLAYRTLGTRADAEDVVQESYLRWLGAPAEEIREPKPYLTTIVARLALDALKAAYRKRETYVGPWLPEPLVGVMPPDTMELAESLSLAFLKVMETLAPAERVAFLLHDVFESDYAAIAQALETSEANARQIVSRARKRIRDQRPRFQVDRELHQEALDRFVAACRGGSVQELISVLRADAVLYSDGGGKAAAALNPIFGADRTARFLFGVAAKLRPFDMRVERAAINGLPGLIYWKSGELNSVLALDLDNAGKIQALLIVLNPEKLTLP